MTSVSHDEITRGLKQAGLANARAVVHSSLRSFGLVRGGARTVAEALRDVLDTVVVPTMLWGEGSAALRPEATEELEYNGIDDEYLSSLPEYAVPFDPLTSGISVDMGAIACAVRALPFALRSNHPLCSWAAVGAHASQYTSSADIGDPFVPLRRLYEERGHVVLLGVTLSSCTAMHLAEEFAGRNPFIRWAIQSDGTIERVRVGGCSDGFDQMLPRLETVFAKHKIRDCHVLHARMDELVDRAAELIRKEPEITMCVRRCQRCLDAVAGGPPAYPHSR